MFGGAITRRNKSAIIITFMSNQRPSDLACVVKDFDHTRKLANQLSENLKNKKHAHLFKTIFVVLILVLY